MSKFRNLSMESDDLLIKLLDCKSFINWQLLKLFILMFKFIDGELMKILEPEQNSKFSQWELWGILIQAVQFTVFICFSNHSNGNRYRHRKNLSVVEAKHILYNEKSTIRDNRECSLRFIEAGQESCPIGSYQKNSVC